MNCMPEVRPVKKAMRSNHRLPLDSSKLSVHLRPNQSKRAIIKLAIAYTSVSVALNQKLSEKVNVKAPTTPLPKIISDLRVKRIGYYYEKNIVKAAQARPGGL